MLNELLLRFRNAAVPGAAGAPAVPAETLDAELAPVFALFADSERVADAIDAEAGDRTKESRFEAVEQTRRVLRDARERSVGKQNTEAAAAFARADAMSAELRARAAAEVARIDGVVPQRLAPLVEELVTRILTRAGATATP